jgi:hypothetical protein
MFYGKNINEANEIISVQMSFSPLYYSDTFIEITEEEYLNFVEKKQEENRIYKAEKRQRQRLANEEIIKGEQEIVIPNEDIETQREELNESYE